jgi:2-succinyl-6-hydroxy-2,4-cyclohexadiene-1-carboxylate synthase
VPESIVLLHGFSGTQRAWDSVIALLDSERYRPLALDLPGHGQAAAAADEPWPVTAADVPGAITAAVEPGAITAAIEPGPITFASCVAHVLAHSPQRFTLCGYSMGGRIALHVALAAPERVRRLVLVSSSPGIQERAERLARSEADHELARELEEIPFEQFIERWRKQPLFAKDPSAVSQMARADQRRNRPAALAAALRGLGTGEMQPLWDRLAELRMPVAVLAGDRDAKFVAIARRMAQALPDGRMLVVPGGHALALENPQAVASALQRES